MFECCNRIELLDNDTNRSLNMRLTKKKEGSLVLSEVEILIRKCCGSGFWC